MLNLSKFYKVAVASVVARGNVARCHLKNLHDNNRNGLEPCKDICDTTTKWVTNWDCVTPGETFATTKNLVFVRVGSYAERKRGLVDKGKVQIENTGKYLKSLNIKWNGLVASTSIEAQESSEIIEKHLPELPKTNCDMLPMIDAKGSTPPDPERYKVEYTDKDYIMTYSVCEMAFSKYCSRDATLKEDAYTILICDTRSIIYFVVKILQFPLERWQIPMPLFNGSITWIQIPPTGHVQLKHMGMTFHIPYASFDHSYD